MKRAMRAALLVLLLSAVGMGKGYAYDFSAACETGQTLYYNITDATNHYVGLTYPGNSSNSPWEGFTKPTGNIVLPETIQYNGVTYIVTSISARAFYYCSDLTGNLSIPNSVTTIGFFAFGGCSGFTGSLTIPTTVTAIGAWAFNGCSGFTGSLTIPNSVTKISGYSFAGCSGFTGNLIIPNSVTSIGDSAFEACIGLSGNLTIPNSVTSIGTNPFSGCYGLNHIKVKSANAAYDSRGNCDAIIETNTNTLISGCVNTSIPNSVITIGDYAFYGLWDLTSLTIPNSVDTIGKYAFQDCSINSVIALGATPPYLLGQGLTFDSGIDQLIVRCGNKSVYETSDWAWYFNSIEEDCSVYNVNIDEENLNGGDVSLSINTANLGEEVQFTITPDESMRLSSLIVSNVNDPSQIVPIYSIDKNSSIFGFIMPPFDVLVKVTFAPIFTVDNLKYSVNDDGTTVTVTGHVDGIAASGTLVIPETVTYSGMTYVVNAIGDYAFSACSELTGSLTIPNSVVTIGDYSFYGCSGFTGVLTIPDSVTLIGAASFANCENFTYIHFNASHCESMGYVEEEEVYYFAFHNNISLNEIVIGDNVITIPACAFANHNSQHCQLVLGNNVEIIGERAFYNGNDENPGLVGELSLPNSVIEIKHNAFYGCRGLTGSLTIGNSVTTIGIQAFRECSGFTGNLTIGNSVTTIGHLAFQGCGFTGNLTIGNFVNSIGNYAFSDSSFTGSLLIPNSVASIGQGAFNNCSGLTSITILSEVPPTFLDNIGNTFYDVPCTMLTVPCGCVSAYEASDWHNYFTTIVEDCSPHDVIIDESSMNGGNVSTSVTSTELGEEVQLTITPDEGMMLASLIVSNVNDPSQTVPVYSIGKNSLIYGFIMPPFDVIVTATFSPTTAIGENNEVLTLVYPNPTNDKVNVEAEDLKHTTISNMLGQIIYDGNASGNEFTYDFSKHNAGIYLIRIETANGVAVKKVSVTR